MRGGKNKMKVKTKDTRADPRPPCKCGRGLKIYNPDNRWNCKDEDRVCWACVKDIKKNKEK